MCQHHIIFIEDWEGDPSIPGGKHDISYYLCTECGEEWTEMPNEFDIDIEPDYMYDEPIMDRDCDYWERVA